MPTDNTKLLEQLLKQRKKQDIEAAVAEAESRRLSRMTKEAPTEGTTPAPAELSAGKAFVRQVVPESLRGEVLSRYSEEKPEDILNPEAQAVGATLGDIYQALLPGPAGKMKRLEPQEASTLAQGYTAGRPAPFVPPRGSESQIEALGTPASRSLSRTPEGTLQVEAMPAASRVRREPLPRGYMEPIEREIKPATEITPDIQRALESVRQPIEPRASRIPVSLLKKEAARQQEIDELTSAVQGTRAAPPSALPKEDLKVAPYTKFVGEEPPPTLDKIPLRDGKFYAERFPGMKYLSPEGKEIQEADSWVIHRADTGKAVATMDVGKTKTPEGTVYSTDWTYYLDDQGAMHTADTMNKIPKDERGVVGELRKELVKLHGGIVSDRAGSTSPLASKSWEKMSGVERVVPRLEGVESQRDVVAPKYGIKGERDWTSVMKAMKQAGYDVDEGQVRKWLDKYGGKAVIGAFGLEQYLAETSAK